MGNPDEYYPVKRPPSRSKILKQSSLFFTVLGFVCILISFVSPTWLQSWPRIHTPFDRLGLWEFCMDGYVHRLDSSMRSYFGCWWIFAPYYSDIREMLLPPWFKAVQAFMTIVMIVQILCLILVCIHQCDCLKSHEQRYLSSRILLYGQMLNTLCILIASAIFGGKCWDRYWMPNYELNWPSWGFGMAIVGGFATLLNIAPLWAIRDMEKRTLDREGGQFPAASAVPGGSGRKAPIYSSVAASEPGTSHSIQLASESAGGDARSQYSHPPSEVSTMI